MMRILKLKADKCKKYLYYKFVIELNSINLKIKLFNSSYKKYCLKIYLILF